MKNKDPVLNFSGQHKLFDPDFTRPTTVIGVGMVGSLVVLSLSKMSVDKITVYDGDCVESHNIPMSLVYRPCDIGLSKVQALKNIVEEHSGVVINTHPKHYENEKLTGSVVCCVDSMKARQIIWQNIRMQPAVDILIDTRVAEELVWVFAINPCDPDDVEYYEHYLNYSDKETATAWCGKHGIVYVAMSAARAVCANLTYWWQYGKKKLAHRELAGVLESIE